MIIQLAGERPGPGQRPMTGRRWGVPQWSILSASPPLLCHSLPSQQPIRMENALLARTTLKIWGFISRPPLTPRQDLTATQPRVNSLGFGLSSPALKQPSTKPFSGLPSRPHLTSPYREAGEAYGERPGIVYPLLPRAQIRGWRSTPPRCPSLLPLVVSPGRPQSWILERLLKREPAAIPVQMPATETPSQPLGRNLQAVKALTAARSLVWLSTPWYKQKRWPGINKTVSSTLHHLESYQGPPVPRSGFELPLPGIGCDAIPPGIIPGTAGSPPVLSHYPLVFSGPSHHLE